MDTEDFQHVLFFHSILQLINIKLEFLCKFNWLSTFLCLVSMNDFFKMMLSVWQLYLHPSRFLLCRRFSSQKMLKLVDTDVDNITQLYGMSVRHSLVGNCSLVATGSLYQVNPDRMVIRKVVLTGHPFKIHKKSAVIRYMFFDRGTSISGDHSPDELL